VLHPPNRFILLALGAAVTLFVFTDTHRAEASSKTRGEEAQFRLPIKKLIGAIRYKKDDLALKLLALGAMTRALNESHWAKMSAAQRTTFETSLGKILAKLSFPKARKLFEHIDAILYSSPELTGDKAQIKTTIVVHRAYKKQELVITWVLTKEKGWKIFDTINVGESTLKGIREEQIDPLVKEGGVALLMKKLQDKLTELK
jgi:ABC-type transporter MlaC component